MRRHNWMTQANRRLGRGHLSFCWNVTDDASEMCSRTFFLTFQSVKCVPQQTARTRRSISF